MALDGLSRISGKKKKKETGNPTRRMEVMPSLRSKRREWSYLLISMFGLVLEKWQEQRGIGHVETHNKLFKNQS